MPGLVTQYQEVGVFIEDQGAAAEERDFLTLEGAEVEGGIVQYHGFFPEILDDYLPGQTVSWRGRPFRRRTRQR